MCIGVCFGFTCDLFENNEHGGPIESLGTPLPTGTREYRLDTRVQRRFSLSLITAP